MPCAIAREEVTKGVISAYGPRKGEQTRGATLVAKHTKKDRLKLERGSCCSAARSIENNEKTLWCIITRLKTFRRGWSQLTTHIGESIPEEQSSTRRKPQFTHARDTAAKLAVSAETVTVLAATTVDDNDCAR